MLRGLSNRWYLWGLLALTFLAFVLRIYRLDAQSLWVDESITLDRSQQPLLELLRNMPAEHAPLYFVLMHFWFPLGGTTDFALRYPSLLFGVLSIPLMGQLGAALFGRRMGLLTALLLVVNPFHIWYAQEARMYALATAFSLASLASLVRALQTNRPWCWAVYALSGALALYTHYYAGLILVVSGLFALIWLARNPTARTRTGRRWLAAVAAMALMFLPWLPQALQVFGFHGWRPPITPQTLLKRYLTAFSLGTSVPEELGWRLTWGFLALAAVGLIALVMRAWRDPTHRPGAWLVWTAFLVTVLGAILLAVRRSDFQERYFIIVTPIYYLTIALGLRVLAWPRRAPVMGAAGLAFILASSAFSLQNHYTDLRFAKPEYRLVTAHIARWADAKSDAIVLSGTREEAVQRYYPGEYPRIYDLMGEESPYRGLDEAGLEALFAGIVRNHRQVWLLVKHEGPDLAYAWFSRETFPVETQWITDIFLAGYSAPVDPLPPMVPPASVRADVPVTLQGYALTSPSVAPGQALLVTLGWVAHARLERDYKVSLRLVDAAGQVTAAVDRPPAQGFNPSSRWSVGETVLDRHGLRVPGETGEGTYQLVVKFYDPADLHEVLSAELGPVMVAGNVRASD